MLSKRTFPVFVSEVKVTAVFFNGSDYGYAWPDPIQIKGSVCHSNGMGIVV